DIDAQRHEEEPLATRAIGGPAEEERAEHGADEIRARRQADVGIGQPQRGTLLQRAGDRAGQRDLEAVEHPGDAQREDDDGVEARPRQRIEPRRGARDDDGSGRGAVHRRIVPTRSGARLVAVSEECARGASSFPRKRESSLDAAKGRTAAVHELSELDPRIRGDDVRCQSSACAPAVAGCGAASNVVERRCRASSVYAVGTTNRVKSVPNSMPPTMTRPIGIRDSAPAPNAVASGTAPSTIAPVVMMIGRSRSVAASTTASISDSPLSRSWLLNSTIRMPCLVMSPTSVTRPTWL